MGCGEVPETGHCGDCVNDVFSVRNFSQKGDDMSFDKLHNAFASTESGLSKDASGNARYEMDHATLMPRKPRSPAQMAAVSKAGKASGVKRKLFGQKAPGSMAPAIPKMGM